MLPGEQPGRDVGGAVHAAERREHVALERSVNGVRVHVVPGICRGGGGAGGFSTPSMAPWAMHKTQESK